MCLALGFLNPPSNQPHVNPLALSKSPTFLPVIAKVGAPEAISPVGSASDISVPTPPGPGATSITVSVIAGDAPCVCPEIRFSAPGVEGPVTVPYELSLIEKF